MVSDWADAGGAGCWSEGAGALAWWRERCNTTGRCGAPRRTVRPEPTGNGTGLEAGRSRSDRESQSAAGPRVAAAQTDARRRRPRSVAGFRSHAATTRLTSAGAGCFGGLCVPHHPDGDAAPIRAARPGQPHLLPSPSGPRPTPRPSPRSPPHFRTGPSPAAMAHRPSAPRRPTSRHRPRHSGGSAEPPPDRGQHPIARERRRGSTRRAASAAAGLSRAGTGFAAAWHPAAARFTPRQPAPGAHRRP
jgi:hypothetical protein